MYWRGRGSAETAVMRRLWAFVTCTKTAIKTTVDCVFLSSKCTYILNGSCKGSGETAQMRILVLAFVARTCSRLIACLNRLWLLNALTFWMGVATAQMRRLVWAFRLLAHAIKTTVDCVSMSSKCTYVLNGSGETAKVRRLVWVFVARTCNKTHRRLRDLLMFWIREVKTLARHFCADSSKVGSPWRDCAFSQRLSERIHSYFGKKMLERYKMRPSFPPFF